ncbi:MAG: CBS domain-containing protein [Gammaproteobacteria bacterium]|nr:CBS domain-containing protein [Gammaproteobacteria bacterium]MCP5137208.1 CBS domain-containing protein [Gammaproteobacteria bacterium]
MPASDIMDSGPIVLQSTDSIELAVQHIMENRFRNLPVVDVKGCYLGVFGVNQLLKMLMPTALVMDHGLTNAPFVHGTVREMSKKYAAIKGNRIVDHLEMQEPVYADTPTLEAMLTLYKSRASVPVLDRESNCLLGVISYWDVGERVLGWKKDPA